jgi:hypothetical protein
MIKIEANVPLPPAKQAKYPYARLKVGESFFVKGKKIHDMGGSTAYWSKRLNTQYVIRTEGDGVRIWRIR